MLNTHHPRPLSISSSLVSLQQHPSQEQFLPVNRGQPVTHCQQPTKFQGYLTSQIMAATVHPDAYSHDQRSINYPIMHQSMPLSSLQQEMNKHSASIEGLEKPTAQKLESSTTQTRAKSELHHPHISRGEFEHQPVQLTEPIIPLAKASNDLRLVKLPVLTLKPQNLESQVIKTTQDLAVGSSQIQRGIEMAFASNDHLKKLAEIRELNEFKDVQLLALHRENQFLQENIHEIKTALDYKSRELLAFKSANQELRNRIEELIQQIQAFETMPDSDMNRRHQTISGDNSIPLKLSVEDMNCKL